MPIPTPYDQKIQKLKQRVGQGGHARQRLNNLRAQRQAYRQQASAPPPMPWAGQAENEIAAADRRYGITSLGLAGQYAATEQQYGFVDQSNPYSVARQLERQRQQQFQRTGNSYARMGQLYATSLSKARGFDQYEADRAVDEQRRAYEARLAEIRQAKAQAAVDRADAVNAARANALQYALSVPVEPSTVPGGGGNKNKNKKKGKKK